jgi:hypothetical protein
MDVIVRLRAETNGFVRTIFQVYSLDATAGFQRVFAHEIGREDSTSRLMDDVRVQPSRIVVGAPQVRGYTNANWPAVAEPGVEPPVTPWGNDRSRTYVFNTSTRLFAFERSEPNPTVAASATPSVAPAPTQEPGANVAGTLAVFRANEHITQTQPSFEATGDAAEDATPENIYIYGRDLVIVGPRFMNGRSYRHIGLPVGEGDSVTGLRMVDVTNDGHVDAVITARRSVMAHVGGVAVASLREMVFVYSFVQPQRSRVFAAEIGRRLGNDAIQNELVLPRDSRGGEITIRARPAVGWTEQTYPFRDGVPQGFEPLLLPWSPTPSITWRWNGTAFVR